MTINTNTPAPQYSGTGPAPQSWNTFWLVHGFNVNDTGDSTVDKLADYLSPLQQEGLRDFDYGWVGLRTIVKENPKIAQRLVDEVAEESWRDMDWYDLQLPSPKTFAVGHSNGCAIIVEAARRGAVFDRVLLINPALDTKTVFPKNCGEVLVIFSKHDKATKSARIARKIPFLRHFIPEAWGAMGTYGHDASVNQPITVTSYDMSASVSHHSGFFDDDVLEDWAPFFLHQLVCEGSYYHRSHQFTQEVINQKLTKAYEEASSKTTTEAPTTEEKDDA